MTFDKMKKELRGYFQLFQDDAIAWGDHKNKVVPFAILVGLIVSPLAISWLILSWIISPISNWLSRD